MFVLTIKKRVAGRPQSHQVPRCHRVCRLRMPKAPVKLPLRAPLAAFYVQQRVCCTQWQGAAQ
jgi:hypothetical protein